jgi:sugar phosphate isomerase/epimerase
MEKTMKPLITAYLNHQTDKKIEGLFDLAIKYNLDCLSLNSFSGKPIIEMTETDIKKLIELSKEKKIKIGIIDPNIKSYDINSDQKHKEALDEFKHIVKFSDRVKSNVILYRLPHFDDVIQQFELLEKRIFDFLDFAVKYSKFLVMLPVFDYKINVFAYIIKKIKSPNLQFAFDPIDIISKNESTITAYRLMKGRIGIFYAHDANHDLKPELIGYGQTHITDLLKKLSRDRYMGYFVMDNKFYLDLFTEPTKKPTFFEKIFSNKQKVQERTLDLLSKRIFPNEETKNVTYDDILTNQINLIRLVFK